LKVFGCEGSKLMRLLAVANPFVQHGGGSYRARKSLIEYPSHGIEPYLLIPPIDYGSYDVDTISTLVSNGVKVIGCLRHNPNNTVVRGVRNLLHLVIPRILTHVDLGNYPSDINAVLSFHEVWNTLWLTQFIALKMRKPSIAILQLPPFYASKRRLKALHQVTKIYYSYVYNGNYAKKIAAYICRNILDASYRYSIRNVLNRYDLVIGISRSIGVEMGLESSGKVYCMDPGVTLDEGDLKLINDLRNRFREKKNYIVFGGRPDAGKGIVEGILVFKKIVECFSDYKLYVTGRIRSSVANRLLRFAKHLGIDGKVVFMGFVPREERLRIVREAKLMLYPSHIDAFSYAVAESLTLGTPVVAYDIPAIDIYYRDLEGIRVVRELDIDAMVDEAIDVLSRSKVEVEAPKLRPWNEIVEEEVNLIKRVVGV